MHLGMTIMAWRDAIGSFGCKDLVGLGLAIGPPLFRETGLEESTTAATAKVIGFIGCHVNEIFFTHNFLDNVSHIFGNGITQSFSHQLTGILKGELDFSVFVPVRRWIEFTFPDPLCIELNNTFNFKVVRDVEFFQSYQDCKEFVPSLRV